jgi:hypothetical protein
VRIRTLVIAGLDPAIHLFKTMDARVKPAHDDLKTMRELSAKAGM